MSFVNKPLTDIMDCTRASTATYIDATGKIRTAGVNEPRIDFSSGQGRLLVEEARTNLLLRSSNLMDSYWTTGSSTTKSDSGIASPLAGVNFTKIEANATTTVVDFSRLSNVGYMAGAITASIYFKVADFSSVMFLFGGGNARVTVNVIDNTSIRNEEAVSGGFTHKVEPRGDGVYRVSVTGSVTGDGSFRLFPRNNDSIGFNDNPAVGSFALVALPQLEQASTPSSYIPTEASAVTRAADRVSRVLGDEFNPFELTWTFEGKLISGTGRQDFIALHSLTDTGGSSSRTYTIVWDKLSSRIRAILYNSGNTPSSISITDDSGYESGDYVKVAASYSKQAQEFRLSINGSIIEVVSYDVTSQMSEITTQLICSGLRDFWENGQTSSEVANVKYFPKALSLSELQEITKL